MLKKKTNFLISSDPTDNPNPVVSSKLTLSYSVANITPGYFIGFRISAASAKGDYTFTTTNNTEFTVPGTLPTIALTSADPTTASVIWQKSDASLTGSIDIEINYNASALPAQDNPLSINVDLFEADALTGWTVANKYSVNKDNASNNLQIQVVTAELTAPITSHSNTDLNASVTSFHLNDNIVLKDVLTTVKTNANYKDINALTFTETINKAISLSYLYISTAAASSISTNKLYDGTSQEISNTLYAAIDISGLGTPAINGITFTSNTSNNIIAIDISQIADTAKFFDAGVLKSPLYVYFDGSIASSAK